MITNSEQSTVVVDILDRVHFSGGEIIFDREGERDRGGQGRDIWTYGHHHPPPLLSPLGVHTFVLYICVSISALHWGHEVSGGPMS